MVKNIKNRIPRAAHNRQAFVLGLPKKAKVLDVGCGNDSSVKIKGYRKDIYYVGVDVTDYNMSDQAVQLADEYIKCGAESFAEDILNINYKFDAVISSHNIEHCNYPYKTIDSMCKVLKNEGRLYMAFPSEKSAKLPHRDGTLNFYDDETHVWLPKYDKIIKRLTDNDMRIVFTRREYRPLFYLFKGIVNEKLSKRNNRVMMGTWALYGFETVLWAKKII